MYALIPSSQQSMGADNAFVRKRNILLDGRYALAPVQNRLVNVLMSDINVKSDLKFKPRKYDISELAIRMKLKGNENPVKELSIVLQELRGLQIMVPDPENTDLLVMTSILENPVIDQKNKTVVLCFAKEFEPYVLEKRSSQNRGYTLIDINLSAKMSRAHEIKFYEVLKRHLYKGRFIFSLHEKHDVFYHDKEKPIPTIHHILGLKKGQYAETKNAKLLVERLCKSIGSRAGIDLRISNKKYHKNGKRYMQVVEIFLESVDLEERISSISIEEQKVLDEFIHFGIDKDKAMSFINAYYVEDKERLTWHLEKARTDDNIKSKSGYLVRAMTEQDYRPQTSLFSGQKEDELKQKNSVFVAKNKMIKKLDILEKQKSDILQAFRSSSAEIRKDILKNISEEEKQKLQTSFLEYYRKQEGYSQYSENRFREAINPWSELSVLVNIRDYFIMVFPEKFKTREQIARKSKIKWKDLLQEIEYLEYKIKS